MTETEIPTTETQEVLEPTIEDMIQAEDGVPFTTSLAIAQAFGKEHKDVLRAISNMECSPEFVERNFALYEYSRELGIGVREYPAYRLTRDGFAFLPWASPAKRPPHGRNASLKPSTPWKPPFSNSSAKRKLSDWSASAKKN